MWHAVIIALDLKSNAPTPHGVDPVQPFYRRLERKPQTSHGVLGIHRNRMATVRMRVKRLDHGFHGGIVKCGHIGVPVGSAAMIVAIPANALRRTGARGWDYTRRALRAVVDPRLAYDSEAFCTP